MCGIAGVIRADAEAPVAEATLRHMAGALRHRGPDGFGLSLEPGAGLVSTRLAIFDVERGWQPLETGASTTIVYNGEVYNHPELRAELSAEGERFETECDTEVVLRLLARDGLTALDRFNGQFALALWEPAARRLTLIRDRFGVRPLYFATPADGSIVFGSEAKAIFASGLVEPRADLRGLDEVFTLWGPRPPRTPFANVFTVRPGGIVTWERGSSPPSVSGGRPRRPVQPRPAPPKTSSSSCFETASACVCEPTSRSARTSQEAWTRA